MEDTLTYEPQVDEQQDPTPKPKKLRVKEFAAKIKAKYPDYKDIDDTELTNKIIAKYPEYKEQVDLTPEVKKKVGSIGLDESSLQAGNSLSTGVGSDEIPKIEMYTTPSGEMVETDPISLSKKYNELKNKTILHRTGGEGTASQFLPDEAARKEADKLQEDFKDFDLGGIYEETKDLNDEILAGHGKRLMQERKENPQLYQRDMANLKWRSGFEKQLLNEVDKGNIDLDNYNRIKHSIDTLPEFTGQGDYSNQRLAIQSLSKDIQLYGGENKDKLLKDFAVEVSKVYGNAYNNKFSEAVKGTPESKYFNEDAQLAYNYLQDVATDKAEQYKRLLIDPKTLKDKSDEQKGYNHLMQTLEETGIGLQQNSVSEELNNLKAIAERNNGLTPEQIQKATDLEKKQDELNQKRDELDKKYPDRITNKVADAVNEIMGHDLNWGEYAMVKTGQALKHTGEGIWQAVSSPFMSDASNNLRELAIMGESITDEANLKQPDKNRNLLYDKFIIEPDLQKQADEIKNDKGLNEEQKRSKLFSLFYNNRDKFGRVPIQNGQFNISPSSILFGVTDLATGILPFVGIEMATGGIGGAGAAAKFIRTFTAAAATTFHDEYAGALMEGKTQSDAYKSAMASTAINSMAMAGAGTPTAIKEMAAGMKTSASKIIAQMSEAEIQKVLAKGTPKGLKAFGQSLKERGKAIPSMVWQGLKTGAKFEAYMTGANILNDREVNFKQVLINTANFGLLGAGLGQIGFKSPTELQKSHGLEFGKNPDEYIQVAKEMKKNGQLSESELNHRIDLIERYGEAYKTLPKANAKGNPLTEKQKADYLYNSVIKNEGNKAKSNLPPKQAELAEHTALVADYANDYILDPKTDKQLEEIKGVLERKIEPKKDAEGNEIKIPEQELKHYKAELEAVNNQIEFNSRYEKITNPEIKEGETGQPPKKPPIGTDADVYTEDKRTELSFRGLQEVATEFGLNDVTSRERKSDLQLFKDAETEIKKWVDEGSYQKNIETVIKDAAERKPISDTQRVILENHIHAERVKANEIAKQKGVNSKEFKDAVNEIDRITKAAITSRQEAGAALRIPTTANNNTASLADAIIATKESKNVSELTDTETAEVEKQYKAIEDANAKFQEYKAEAEAKFKEYQAKIEMLEAGKKTTKGKKTATDLKTEREDIKKSILEKWNKAKNVGIVNNPKEDLLIQLAPDIAKLMRNYYQDGVRQLGEMVDKIHTYLKDLGIGVDASDVQDMIAGKYNQKKLTKNEMVAEIKGLQYEAKALKELKSLMNKEPRNEKEKRKKNEKLAEIRKQINVLKKEQGLDQYSDQAKVDRAIAANKAKEEKYKEKLKKGEFEKQPKHKTVYEAKEWQQQNPSLYKKLLDSQAKADQARADFEAGLIENEMKNAGLGDKFRMVAKKSSGTLKQLFASFDLSAIAVQNLPFILTQPKTSAKGLPRSFVHMGSQKQFDRYLTELHNSSYWPIFKDMGLRVTEPKSLLEATREDYFPDRFKAVVKINGKEYGWVNIGGHKYELLDLSKPFERQFTSLGNLLRTVKATTEIDILKSKGITFENSPEEYKTLAKRLNNLTSSPDIPQAYQNEITRTLIWSSRLVAAKLNMLGISDVAALIPGTGVKKGYYRGLGVKGQKISRQQAMAAYDLAKFATSVVALTYLVALMKGGTVNTNPTSNQFMDVEYDDGKSMNLTGGFSSYIAKLFQFANWGKTDKYGVFKPYKGTDPIKESMAFMGSKAPPVTRSLENVVAGQDQFGQDADISTEASKYKMPLAIGQIYDQIQKDGVGALFTEGIPTLIGFNAKDNRNYNTHKFSNDTEKFIVENQVPISMPQKVYTKNGEKIEMTKDEYKDFLNQVDKEIDNITSDIKKNGGYVIRNKEIVQLPYSKLTKEEISEMTKEMITEATAQIRKDKFKTDEETDEYIEKSTIEEILRQTRKVQRQK